VYIGPKSRTERHRKTKIRIEVAHITSDSDTTFKVKRSKVNLMVAGILWRPSAHLVDDAIDQRRRRLMPAFEPQEDILNIHCDIN